MSYAKEFRAMEKANVDCFVELRMTSPETHYKEDFYRVVSSPTLLGRLARDLTSDLDLFMRIIKDRIGMERFMRMFGRSDEVDPILFYPVTLRVTELMTHERSTDFVTRLLEVCNNFPKRLFCHILNCEAHVIVRDEKGCVALKKAITLINDDSFQDTFLTLIAESADSLVTYSLGGLSLMQHVLKLDYTRKTTQQLTPLHELMAEFDEVLLDGSDDDHRITALALKLTSDPDLFLDCVRTKRGAIMVNLILEKSEEIDTAVLAAMKQRFTDVATEEYPNRILVRTSKIFKERKNYKVYRQLLRLIGVHALCLSRDPSGRGQAMVLQVIDIHLYTDIVACGLQCRYVELSFLKYGSKVVERLLDEDCRTATTMIQIMIEIVKCDEDTLVSLAMDEYGNKILKKALEVSKADASGIFDNLEDKFKPFLERLRGSQAENIAAIIDPEFLEITIKDRIVSEG